MSRSRQALPGVAAVLAVIGVLAAGGGIPAVAQGAQDLYRITNAVSQCHVEYHRVVIRRGSEVPLADLRGPGKVTYFYITDGTQGRWYQGLVLKVFWDDETQPSLQAPLSDFFGAMAGNTVDFQSAAIQINHGCFMCLLPMPFARRARFVLANDGDRDYSESMAYGIDYETDPAYASVKSRLHCHWVRSNPVREGIHTIVEAQGRGHYVGGFLQVYTTWKGWWGEGDTLLHIDGREMTHTPGTEDEYGSCWGFEHLYSYEYSGYLLNENGSNRMYRWYVMNPIRFQKTLRVDIQNQRFDRGQIPSADDYTSIAFWYQEEPHKPIPFQGFAERTAASKAAVYKPAGTR